jgi:hypothetical protein
MKQPSILVADTLHFSPRKFPPLYDFAARRGVRIWAEKSRSAWWERADGYHSLADKLAPHCPGLEGLTPPALMSHRYRDIDVFSCARVELLRLLPQHWAEAPTADGGGEPIAGDFAGAQQRREVLLCMAAAQDWIDFWHRIFDRNGPFSHAVVHRGGAIHSRTLLEVASRRGVRTFVADRFATGSHFFFEERTAPVAESSLLADPGWYAQLALPSDRSLRERLRAEAYRRLAPIRAAVVARPRREDLAAPFGDSATGIALVVGQPIGELSLLDMPLPGCAAPAICRRMIAGLLDRTDFQVVLQLDGPPLAPLVDAWRGTLPPQQRARLHTGAVAPLDILLPQAKLVVSGSAALTLAACRAGLKPVQLEPTALAGKGFTNDFADPDDFLDDLCAGRVDLGLSLDEYRGFEDFLARLMVLHLVPDGEEGAAKIAARLAEPNHVPTWRECNLSGAPAASPWRAIANAAANPTAALRLARTWSRSDRD